MSVVSDLTQLIGHTPLIHLHHLNEGVKPLLLAKFEPLSIGGSSKDRIALQMILAAEKSGELKSGGTIVEPTSGNTGVGLAIVAAQRGYKCIFVLTDKVASEKIALLRAYGAEIHVCPYAVDADDPRSYYLTAQRLADETPNSFRPNQYENPNNPLAHELGTGPEIWEQTNGRITHFVAGAGTGGTLSGTSRYLKAQNPVVQIVAADPFGSVYSGEEARPYLVEGIGEDFWPATYDPATIDRVIPITDAESFNTARMVSRVEALLIGGSGGTAVAAALHLAKELNEDDVVVVHIPDSGRGYLSKVFDDRWMSEHGFLNQGGFTVGELLSSKGDEMPDLVHVHPEESVRYVIGILNEFNVSQLPVAKHEPPLVAAEVVGAASERALLVAAFADPSVLDRPIGDVMSKPMPVIGAGETVDAAVRALGKADALLVLQDGHPKGVLTSTDVLEYLASQPKES